MPWVGAQAQASHSAFKKDMELRTTWCRAQPCAIHLHVATALQVPPATGSQTSAATGSQLDLLGHDAINDVGNSAPAATVAVATFHDLDQSKHEPQASASTVLQVAPGQQPCAQPAPPPAHKPTVPPVPPPMSAMKAAPAQPTEHTHSPVMDDLSASQVPLGPRPRAPPPTSVALAAQPAAVMYAGLQDTPAASQGTGYEKARTDAACIQRATDDGDEDGLDDFGGLEGLEDVLGDMGSVLAGAASPPSPLRPPSLLPAAAPLQAAPAPAHAAPVAAAAPKPVQPKPQGEAHTVQDEPAGLAPNAPVAQAPTSTSLHNLQAPQQPHTALNAMVGGLQAAATSPSECADSSLSTAEWQAVSGEGGEEQGQEGPPAPRHVLVLQQALAEEEALLRGGAVPVPHTCLCCGLTALLGYRKLEQPETPASTDRLTKTKHWSHRAHATSITTHVRAMKPSSEAAAVRKPPT